MDEIQDYYLPAIQREFVWEPEKIERFFDSLLRGYPIGTLLFWRVREPAIHEVQFYELVRVFNVRNPHNVKANLRGRDHCIGILDGQQRVTSLLIGLKGSYTAKLPRKHRTNPDAYPEKKLYIDMLSEPVDDDPDSQFRVKFLRPQDAIQNESEHWFEFGKILDFRNRDQLLDFRQKSPLKANPIFERNLDRLYTAIVESHAITYFEETRSELDEVLEIFVRLNTGGTPLSYSDLLLSLSTASWERDARELVFKLVESLNQDCGADFRFEKDFVLKTLLVFSGRDVRFRLRNFSSKAGLEAHWNDVEKYLRLTVRLIASFGLDGDSLSSSNAIIPIAYYLFRRTATDRHLTSREFENDRHTMKLWLTRTLLKGAFGGNSDSVLTNARQELDDWSKRGATGDFPSAEISGRLNMSEFTDEEVGSLVTDTSYGTPGAFQVLTLLYPRLDYQHSLFHIDHIHPRASFTEKQLRAQGMSESDVAWSMDHFNSLPNLQLLEGKVNQAKLSTPFEKWLEGDKDPESFKARNYIPNVSLGLANFKSFWEARKELLTKELRNALGVRRLVEREQDQGG